MNGEYEELGQSSERKESTYGAKDIRRTSSYHNSGQSGSEVVFTKVKFSVPVKSKEDKSMIEKHILNGISGFADPGTITSIMGPTGSGKTTLLDMLSGRNIPTAGYISVNGQPLSKDLDKVTGFVPQEDLLFPLLTVRETLIYYAHLRLPKEISDKEKEVRVDEIISELNLEKVSDSYIGDAMMRGISGGEKKRVSIGCELIHKPKVLYLDEPTSGLDSSTAFSVMLILKKLAQKGRTIICTIHQPRSNIFSLFDNLMLLANGSCLYFGPSDQSMEHFTAMGYKCPEWANAADFMVDVASMEEFGDEFFADLETDFGQSRGLADAVESYPKTAVGNEMMRKTRDRLNKEYPPEEVAVTSRFGSSEYYTSFLRQVSVLFSRAWKNRMRNPVATYAALSNTVFMGLLIGLLYFNVSNGQTGAQDRIGAIFFVLTNQAFSVLASLRVFLEEREIFAAEKQKNIYRTSSYFIAKLLSELPGLVVFPSLFIVISYFMVGFKTSADAFFIFWITIVLVTITSSSFSVMVGALVQDFNAATIITPVGTALSLLFAGFFINIDSIPVYFTWIQWISLFKYSFAAVAKSQFRGLVFTCTPQEELPDGTCPINTGEDQLDRLNLGDIPIAVDILALIAMIVFYYGVAYIALRVRYKPVRAQNMNERKVEKSLSIVSI